MNNKITYHKEGDYFIPDLYLEKENYKKEVNLHHQNYKRTDCPINGIVVCNVHKGIQKTGNNKESDCA